MKKNTLFLTILLVSGALTSCLRSDDLEMLKHPIHVTGSVNPEYGVPVATGEMNINDLLSHLSAEYQGLIADDEEVITVEYETALSDTIYAFSQIPTSSPAPSQSPIPTKDLGWYSKDTTFFDTIDIDFFNDVDFYGHMEMEHIWVDLKVSAHVVGHDSIFSHIKGTFDDLVIKYEDHEGNPKTFNGLPVSPIEIDNMADGFEHSFQRVDVASIANDLPRRIITQYRFTFKVSSHLVNQSLSDLHFGAILDSISSSKLIYTADLAVSIPLSILFNNLTYSYDLDLGDGLSSVNLDSIFNSVYEGLSVDIDTSRIRMDFDNGIPMEFTVSAVMKDANGNDLVDLFQNARVASANIDETATPAVASTSVKSSVETVITGDDLDKIDRARTIKLTLRTDTNNKHVAVRRDDYLKIKAFLQVSPAVDFDISVTDGGIL